jgi:hypothetical protein
MKRHLTCFVEKAGLAPRTLGTKAGAMTTALHARLSSVYTCHVPVFNPILVVPVTVSKKQSSRQFSF